MALFDDYAVEGFGEFLASLFALVPAGFLLGLLCGFLAFGIFGLFRLVKALVR